MKSLIRLFVRNTVFANLLMVIIVLGGILATTQMIRELFPTFVIDTILIRVPYLGAGPEEVEEGISLKIEDAIEGVQGIKRYTTTAAEGMGTAVIEVEEGEDVQVIKDRVADRINAIQTFPEDAEKPVVSELIIRRDTLVVAVTGDIPEYQLKELANDIKEEMQQLPNVSDVEIRGTRDYEISIEVSEETLRKYGITFDDVSRAIRDASLNLPGGEIRTNQQDITIRTMGRRYTGKEYSDIIVMARADGTSIRLDQIATIRDEFVEDEVISRYNGKPAVSITVYNGEEDDSLIISNNIKKYIAEKNQELPDEVKLHVWLNSTRFITDRIDLLVRNGRIGLALVFLLLWFFLDLRLAIWVSLGIPISLSGAMLLMAILGESINMISLFAMLMVLGIIVDDAIVVGESIYVHRKMGKGPIQAAIDGTAEVAMPVFAAVITTCVAFIPLMFVSGIMGNFIRVIPIVVICALLVSLLEGLLVLPAHLNKLPDLTDEESPKYKLQRFTRHIRNQFANRLELLVTRIYRPFIRFCLSWRYVSFAAIFAVLFITMGMLQAGKIKFVFFPQIDTSFLIGRVEFPEGTPIETTRKAVLRMEDALNELSDESQTISGKPMVVSIESNIGMRIGMDNGYSEAKGAHLGEIRVELLDAEERGEHYRDVVRRWEEKVGNIPGALSLSFQGQSGGPPGMPIEIWLLGNDLDELRDAADATKQKLSTFAGVFQIEDDFRPGKREIRAHLKPEARTLGLTTNDLARQLRRGFYGDEVLRVQRGDDEIKVWVRYPEKERQSLSVLQTIRIRTPDGEEVPLDAVADLVMDNGYTTITRKDGKRRIAVTADVFTEVANPSEILQEMTTGFLKDLSQKYPGVTVALEGEKRESQESFSSLIIGFPLAMMGIYLIIATLFRSYIQPIIIMITIPFGIIGAVWGHWLLGYDLSIMSMFGMVALAGVVVNDAIVLIEAVNQRLANGTPFVDAIVEGGSRRFRAIMLTTATTVGGLMPLIMETNFQAQFLIPMALTIASGVAFATILTLGVLPCLLFILNDIRRFLWYLRWKQWPTMEAVEPASRRELTDEELEQAHMPREALSH